MYKVVITIILFFFLSCCSVYHKNKEHITIQESETEVNLNSNSVAVNNLSRMSFIITAFELNINDGNSNERLSGTIKRDLNNKHLIVLRSFAGIEVLRILVKSDSVFIIDRINRKYYYGSSLDMERRSGFSIKLLPLLYGDLLLNSDDNIVFNKLNSENSRFDAYIEGKRLELYIDSHFSKLKRAVLLNSFLKTLIDFEYSGYKKIENVVYPSYIKVSIEGRNLTFGILLKKFQYPWIGVIDNWKNPGYASDLIK